jgi:dynein heavy chain
MLLQLDHLEETLAFLGTKGTVKESQIKQSKKLFDDWTSLKKLAKDIKKEITPIVATETQKNNVQIGKLEEELKLFIQDMKKRDFYRYDCGRENAIQRVDAVVQEVSTYETKIEDFGYTAKKFDNPNLIDGCNKHIEAIKLELGNMKVLWDHINTCQQIFNGYLSAKWVDTQPYEMEDDVKKLLKSLKEMKVDKRANAYGGLLEEIKKWLVFLPLIAELADPAMRDRHWDAIRKKVGKHFEVDDKLVLSDVYNLNLQDYKEDVEEITDQAKQEAKMEKTLAKLEEIWKDIKFDFYQHKNTDVMLIRLTDENFDLLEENTNAASSMQSSRYIATFESEVEYWTKSLGNITDILTVSADVQRNWAYLENLFLHSDEVKKELPEQAKDFVFIDQEVKRILADATSKQFTRVFCDQDWVLKSFNTVYDKLQVCEKALNRFMDEKKKCFPRFYFTSSSDLLDILSNGNMPVKIMKFMSKIFQAIENLELKDTDKERPIAVGMHTNVGIEYVEFSHDLKLLGKVENYLQEVINTMKTSLRDVAAASLKRLAQYGKEKWLTMDPAQTTLLINMLTWTKDVEGAFDAQKNDPLAMKTAHGHQVKLLSDLIKMVQGDLSRPMRQKIGCMITMDAHSRDIIM